MTANELRIGNWVQLQIADFSGNRYKRVDGIIIQSLETLQKYGNKIAIGGIAPIPLTPEILEKAGAKYMGGDAMCWCIEVSEDIDYYFTPAENESQVTVFDVDPPSESSFVSNVMYLHQLQNLYFALTGEELNIEL